MNNGYESVKEQKEDPDHSVKENHGSSEPKQLTNEEKKHRKGNDYIRMNRPTQSSMH